MGPPAIFFHVRRIDSCLNFRPCSISTRRQVEKDSCLHVVPRSPQHLKEEAPATAGSLSPSSGTDAFIGTYAKSAGSFFFNGPLQAVQITNEAGTVFVQVVCSCDVRGKYVAEFRDNRLRFTVPFQGEAFAVWLERGTKLNVLGGEFTRVVGQ